MIKIVALILFLGIFLIIFLVSFVLFLLKKNRKRMYFSLISFVLSIFLAIFLFFAVIIEVKETTSGLKELIFPTFDAETPDTEANKRNFRRFLKVDVSPDVKNIYCFDDAFFRDPDYMFAFNCNAETAQRIINRNYFKKDTLKGSQRLLQHDFFWWDSRHIDTLERYYWELSSDETKNIRKYFWYDAENQKAYYFECEFYL